MSGGLFVFDEPFEGDRVPTAADLDRAKRLDGIAWWEPSALVDDEPASPWRVGDRVQVHEVPGGYVVLPDVPAPKEPGPPSLDEIAELIREAAATPPPPESVKVAPDLLERLKARAGTPTLEPPSWHPTAVGTFFGVPVVVDESLAPGEFVVDSGPPPAPGIREAITAAAQRFGLQLTPWQRRVVEAALDPRRPRPLIAWPRRSGRKTVARVVDEAIRTENTMPLSRDLHVTITADASGALAALSAAADRLREATHIFRFSLTEMGPKLRRIERRQRIEQHRIRQAMRHIERRAARRQRRAASRASRTVTR